jgi:hypothetical protein
MSSTQYISPVISGAGAGAGAFSFPAGVFGLAGFRAGRSEACTDAPVAELWNRALAES